MTLLGAPPSPAKPSIVKNNTWYRVTPSRTAVVFLHGLNSNSDGCWRNAKAKTFWPDLITADPLFEDPSIFMAGYDTGMGAGRFDVYDAVDTVMGALKVPPTVSTVTPLSRDRLLFVCHSQGGIIVRKMLTVNVEAFRDIKVGLALFGSPSWGSRYANILFPLMKLFGHKQAQQLRRDDGSLVYLDRDFKKLLASKQLDICGYEWVETRGFIRGLMRVVRDDSATRYFEWQRIPRVSHTAIVKPDSAEHASHSALRTFASEHGFCTLKRLREAVSEVKTAMGAVVEAYDATHPRSTAAQSEAAAALITKARVALPWLDRFDRQLPLEKLSRSAVAADTGWMYYALSREEFAAIGRQLDAFLDETKPPC